MRASLIIFVTAALGAQLPLLDDAHAACPGDAMRYASSSNRLYVDGPVTCTLTDLASFAKSTALDEVAPGIWLLSANLHLSDGAALILHGTSAGGDVDELRLRSDPGGFVYIRADWGRIDIAETRVTSWDGDGPDTNHGDGRAFIHVRSRLGGDGDADQSRMDIRDSDLGYLGYKASESYGLVWKVSGSAAGLYDKVDVLGDVTDSRIHHNYFGAYTYGAHGMRWLRNQIDHNVEYGLDPHDDSDHLLIEDNRVHDNGNHGIICSKRCNDLVIRGNRTFGNDGNGIMIHRQVEDTLVEDNESYGNADAGIAVFNSTGNVIRGNHLHDNRRGLRLSVASSDNLFEDNLIEDNSQYGIYVYHGSDVPTGGGPGTNVGNVFRGNVVEDNGMAVKAEAFDDNQLTDNRFAGNGGGFLFRDARNNLLSGNTIPEDHLVETKTSTVDSVTIISRARGPLRVETDGDAKVLLRETSSRSYIVEGVSGGAKVTPSESVFTLNSSRIDSAKRVVPVAIYGDPSSGSIYLTATSATSWRSRSTSGTVSVAYTVGALVPGATYRAKRGSTTLARLAADADGVIRFSDAVGTSNTSYSVVRD